MFEMVLIICRLNLINNYGKWQLTCKLKMLLIAVNLKFLLSVYGQAPFTEQGQTSRDMCKHTLTMMFKGGIWDHVSKVSSPDLVCV